MSEKLDLDVLEDRVTNLEQVVLILRSKVEPDTLTVEALVIAKDLEEKIRGE